MTTVEVLNLVKCFGDTRVVDDLTFNVARGEIVALLGSSGCGKTTTLRCIAGLETPTSGQIRIDGQLVVGGGVNVPTERRGVGMVFQSYAVWPHKTVFENVAYGLRVKRTSRSEITTKVEEVLHTVLLSGLEKRYPGELSGGQQQRVALARSIVCEPAVLLLDEPLSNLDAKLREQMRDELRVLIKRLGITAVHITHDQAEAMAIADRVAVMNQGRIVQDGTGRDLYRRPTSPFVAEFIGATSFLEGTVTEAADDRVLVRTAAGLAITCSQVTTAHRPGDEVTLSIRPEHVEFDGTSDQANRWSAKVVHASFLGAATECTLDVGDESLRATTTLDLEEGQLVEICVQPEHVVVLGIDPVDEPLPNAAAVGQPA